VVGVCGTVSETLHVSDEFSLSIGKCCEFRLQNRVNIHFIAHQVVVRNVRIFKQHMSLW
jgi:hypothetical protein